MKVSSKTKIKALIPRLAIVLILFLLIGLWSVLSPAFLTTNNLMLIIKQVTLYGILAVGMTFVIITGGIDLSVGSVVAFCCVFSAHYISGDYADNSLIIPIAISIGMGLLWGAINGLGVAYAKVPSFIMTMCTMLAARGLAYIYTDAKAIFFLSDRFVNIANGFINRTFDETGTLVSFGIPYMVFYFIAAMAIGIIVLQHTSFGRKIYAVGGNAVSARYSGINVKRITCSAYIISGLCAGICGFLMASRISSGNANAADGYEMTVIAAAVIGGVSMSGGIGTMTGTTIGVLIIGVISNGMDILGVNSYFQKVLQALIIFAAVYVDGRLNAKKK